jgi:peptide/nickel transport system substrate-binding protein
LRGRLLLVAAAGALLAGMLAPGPAEAQKSGGILRIPASNSPASMSIHEESTRFAVTPAMGVFNKLVLFDQHIAQNDFDTIRPELAASWDWNEEGRGNCCVRASNGMTAAPPPPTSNAPGTCSPARRDNYNPRKSCRSLGRRRLTAIAGDIPSEALASLLALLASGASPVYPCHVSPAQMRQHPIGTGPFKLVEFKPNEAVKLIRNPDYWKPGRPYLDGIEYSIIANVSTQVLAFAAGKFDMSFPYGVSIPVLGELKSQAPQAECELTIDNGSRTMIVNRTAPPFDNAELRRAMGLALDRKAFVDILTEGQGAIGATMLPPPDGIWGMPPEMLARMPGYDADVGKRREEARKIMQTLGYGPDKRLPVTVTTRNTQGYRDPAVIMIDQLKEVYIDGKLDAVDTAVYFPKVLRKDYTVGMAITETALDDPDQMFFENYVCGAERNYTGYCNPETDKLINRQSAETDVSKRRQLVWDVERQLAEERVRPVIFFTGPQVAGSHTSRG